MRPLPTVALLYSFAALACGGGRAGGQTAAPASPEAPRLYEVAPQQGARSRQTATADTGVVRVSGSGRVTVSPDHARVTFAVETQEEEAAAASRANATLMTAVLDAVRGTGVEGLELETFGYSLRPVYSSESRNGQRTQEVEGYRAVNNVGATLTDIDAVGGVVDAAIGAGANRIGGLTFYAEDTQAAREQALVLAVEEATRQARTIARALGRTLGDPVDIQGGSATPGPRPERGLMDMAMARAETPIEAGGETVSAQISITFALGPRAPR